MIFLMVFHVPVLPINILYIITPVSYLYLLLNRGSKYVNKEQLRSLYTWLILMIAYQSLISISNGYSFIESSVGMIWWAIAVIPISLSIIISCGKKPNRGLSFIYSLTFAVLIQCLCAYIAVVSPSMKAFFLKYVDTENLIRNGQYFFRLFGWARYLTGFTAMSMGLIAGLFFYHALSRKKLFYIFTIMTAIAGVINARTSAVIFVGCVTIAFLFYGKNLIKKIVWLVSIASVVSIILLSLNLKGLSDNDTISWITDGFNEISGFIEGEDTGYFAYATNEEKWSLPHDSRFVFGEGTDVFDYHRNVGFTSDIGYISDIWSGGILFSFCFYSFILVFLVKLYKNEKHLKRKDKIIIPGMLAMTLFISNVKGILNSDNDLICVVFLILCLKLIYKEPARKPIINRER